MTRFGGAMGPGYVQGGTRSPPEHPEVPFREVLYSDSLWLLLALARQSGQWFDGWGTSTYRLKEPPVFQEGAARVSGLGFRPSFGLRSSEFGFGSARSRRILAQSMRAIVRGRVVYLRLVER